MLTELHKAQQLINESKNILIVPQEEICGDSLGSALALKEGLQKSGNSVKNINTHLSQNIPSQLQFLLPKDESITGAPLFKNLTISINDNLDRINTVHYEKQDGKLKVVLSLERDHDINNKDIEIKTLEFNYDLIITLDTPNLNLLGKIYEDNPSLFDNTPIINIDNHDDNWLFGNINLVNPKSSSTAEIVVDFLNFLNIPVTENCATCLLCGIIEKTQSFRKPQTTPGTFRLASELLNKGAKQELIIRHLYKTKPLDTVRLWGEIMTGIKYDNGKKIISSFITQEMFQKTNTDISILKQLMLELKENFSSYNHFLILWESENNTRAIFSTKNISILENISSLTNGKIKNSYLVMEYPENNLYKAEAKIFNLIQSIL